MWTSKLSVIFLLIYVFFADEFLVNEYGYMNFKYVKW